MTDLSTLINGWNHLTISTEVPDRLTPWDMVVLTASGPTQGALYRRQLEHLSTVGRLPSTSRYVVVEDPGGHRIGSGGATLNALRQLGGDCGPGSKVLLVHAGGDSKRLPWANLLGKAFVPLPLLCGPDDGVPTLFEHLLALAAPTVAKLDMGGCLILTGDVLPLTNLADQDLPEDGACILTTAVTLDVAGRHGVVVPGDDATVVDLVQKGDPETLAAHGAVIDSGRALLDTGVITCTGSTWSGLLDLARATDNPVDRLIASGSECSLYEEVVGALVPARHDWVRTRPLGAELINATGSGSLTYHRDDELIFVHLGSAAEFQEHLAADWHGRLESRALARASSTASGRSCIALSHVAGAVIGSHSLVYGSRLGKRTTIGRRCAVVAVEATAEPLVIPDHTCLWQVPLADGRMVTCVTGVDDNPKLGTDRATFINRSLKQWMITNCIAASELWPEDTPRDLWRARLFPVHAREGSLGAISWLVGTGGGASGARQWRESERLSLSQVASRADPYALWRQLATTCGDIVQEILVDEAVQGQDRDLGALVGQITDDGRRQRIAALADISLPAHLPASRRLRIRADLLSAASDPIPVKADRAQAMDAVVEEVRSAISTPTAHAVTETVTDSLTVELPARFDLAGGWSDTPPWCLERPARVTNMAIALDGVCPIGCSIEKLDDNVWELSSRDGGRSERYTSEDVANGPTKLGDFFHLSATALRCAGYGGPNGISQGVRLTTWSAVPRGSGLGTSSILGAAVLTACQRLAGRADDPTTVSELVLDMEQHMGTGGGWQDQVGGLWTGAKCVTSLPTKPLRLQVDPIPLSDATIAELETRLVLIFTGQERLAKNVLQIVVGRYLGRDRRLIGAIGDLVTLADEARAALAGGDIDRVGEVLAEAWQAHQLLDPHCSNPGVDFLMDTVEDLTVGAKLAGAGGGGFLGIIAKDADAADRIRERLTAADKRVQPFAWSLWR